MAQPLSFWRNENMVNWEELEKVGISKASLEQQGLLDSMLKGYKTNKLEIGRASCRERV